MAQYLNIFDFLKTTVTISVRELSPQPYEMNIKNGPHIVQHKMVFVKKPSKAKVAQAHPAHMYAIIPKKFFSITTNFPTKVVVQCQCIHV